MTHIFNVFDFIKYCPGGVKSGFNEVDAEPVVNRLYKVAGKARAELKPFNIKGVNITKSDCWILDQGKKGEAKKDRAKILVYVPPGATLMNTFKEMCGEKKFCLVANSNRRLQD